MKLIWKIKAVFVHDTCFHCGATQMEGYNQSYLDSFGGPLMEEGHRCASCKTHHNHWAHGHFDDPLVYIDGTFDRFKYIFFGIMPKSV